VSKRRTWPWAPVPVGARRPATGGAAGQLHARRQAALRVLPQPHAAAAAGAAAARPAVGALDEPAVVAATVAVVGGVAGGGDGAGAAAAPAAVALAGDAAQLRVPAGPVLRRPCAGRPHSASARAHASSRPEYTR